MNVQDWMPLIFVGGLTLIAWSVTRMRYRKKHGGARSADQIVNHTKPSELAAMSKEVAALLVELEETGRRIAAQIENRYQKLDALIAEAEEKIGRLEKLKRELGIADAAESVLPPGAPEVAQPFSAPAVTPASPPPKIDVNSQHIAVYALADRGKTSREIAAETGKQPGEVELILALRR